MLFELPVITSQLSSRKFVGSSVGSVPRNALVFSGLANFRVRQTESYHWARFALTVLCAVCERKLLLSARRKCRC
jgi:hypothetical protein